MSDVAFANRVAELFASQPERWDRDRHVAKFGDLSWSLWIANGRGYVAVSRMCVADTKLSRRARWIIWRAFQRWDRITGKRRLVQLFTDLTAELNAEAEKDAA